MLCVGRRWIVTLVSALAVAGAACSGGGSLHETIAPDTPHNDVAGYTRFITWDYRRGLGPGNPGHNYDFAAAARRYLPTIRCDQRSLRKAFAELDTHDEAETLRNALPARYFKCGRSAVVQAVNASE